MAGPFKSAAEHLVSTRMEEIEEKVKEILVESLNVDYEEIQLTSLFGADFRAESIDYLDIIFRLEREFGLKIPGGEIFPSEFSMKHYQYTHDGKLTAQGAQDLLLAKPWLDREMVNVGMELTKISDLMTVGAVCRYVQIKLLDQVTVKEVCDLIQEKLP